MYYYLITGPYPGLHVILVKPTLKVWVSNYYHKKLWIWLLILLQSDLISVRIYIHGGRDLIWKQYMLYLITHDRLITHWFRRSLLEHDSNGDSKLSAWKSSFICSQPLQNMAPDCFQGNNFRWQQPCGSIHAGFFWRRFLRHLSAKWPMR